ncbi:MAG: hypothetical protein M3P04_05990 [Actinomycetota bacterium]|nr:hypothetical protein [Actinomycetota bacterium]
MSRRIALPGADELFRSTGEPSRQDDVDEIVSALTAEAPPMAAVRALPEPASSLTSDTDEDTGLDETALAVRSAPRRRSRSVAERRPSGRERHDEKITVYVSAEELMDLEQARLTLRGDFGLPVDRGRVVREALVVVLADLEAKGEASILVRRLRGR